MIQVTADHLSEAAKLLGKQMLDSVPNGRQALLLSDHTYLHRLTLGSVNRDVNPKWVSKLKREMHNLIMARERTTITVCIDLRDVIRAIEEQAGATDFKAIVLDGQHRVACLKEMFATNPRLQYEFWMQVYVMSSEVEMESLIEDLDRRLPISAKDKKTIQDRRSFAEAFISLIPASHHTRRCITGTLNHKVLRMEAVVEALQHTNTEDLVKRIREMAQASEDEFRKSSIKSSSILYKVIEDTKLYQLVHWETGDWILRLFQIDAKSSKNDESIQEL